MAHMSDTGLFDVFLEKLLTCGERRDEREERKQKSPSPAFTPTPFLKGKL